MGGDPAGVPGAASVRRAKQGHGGSSEHWSAEAVIAEAACKRPCVGLAASGRGSGVGGPGERGRGGGGAGVLDRSPLQHPPPPEAMGQGRGWPWGRGVPAATPQQHPSGHKLPSSPALCLPGAPGGGQSLAGTQSCGRGRAEGGSLKRGRPDPGGADGCAGIRPSHSPVAPAPPGPAPRRSPRNSRARAFAREDVAAAPPKAPGTSSGSACRAHLTCAPVLPFGRSGGRGTGALGARVSLGTRDAQARRSSAWTTWGRPRAQGPAGRGGAGRDASLAGCPRGGLTELPSGLGRGHARGAELGWGGAGPEGRGWVGAGPGPRGGAQNAGRGGRRV